MSAPSGLEDLLLPWSMLGTMGLVGVIGVDLCVDFSSDPNFIYKYYQMQTTPTTSSGQICIEKLFIPLLILISFVPVVHKLFFSKYYVARNPAWKSYGIVFFLGVLEAVYFILYLKPMETNLYTVGVVEKDTETATSHMEIIRKSHLVMLVMKMITLSLLHQGQKVEFNSHFKNI